MKIKTSKTVADRSEKILTAVPWTEHLSLRTSRNWSWN